MPTVDTSSAGPVDLRQMIASELRRVRQPVFLCVNTDTTP